MSLRRSLSAVAAHLAAALMTVACAGLSLSSYRSDKIFAADLTTGIQIAHDILSTGDASSWHLPGAPYFLPDLALATIAASASSDPLNQILVVNLFLALLFSVSTSWLFMLSFGKNWKQPFIFSHSLFFLLALILFCTTQSIFESTFGFFSRQFVHFGTQINSTIFLAYWIRSRHTAQAKNRVSSLAVLFAAIASLSDVLFVSQAIFPCILLSIFFSGRTVGWRNFQYYGPVLFLGIISAAGIVYYFSPHKDFATAIFFPLFLALIYNVTMARSVRVYKPENGGAWDMPTLVTIYLTLSFFSSVSCALILIYLNIPLQARYLQSGLVLLFFIFSLIGIRPTPLIKRYLTRVVAVTVPAVFLGVVSSLITFSTVSWPRNSAFSVRECIQSAHPTTDHVSLVAADYWIAKKLSFSSLPGLVTISINSEGGFHTFATNTMMYERMSDSALRTLTHGNIAISPYRLNRSAIITRFGIPIERIICDGIELWMYPPDSLLKIPRSNTNH